MTEAVKITISTSEGAAPLEVQEVSADGKSTLSLWKHGAGEEIDYEISPLSRLEIAFWPEDE